MASPFKELMALDPTREQVEAWCRRQAQAVPAGADTLLCRVLGKYLMYVHQRDYALTPHLAMNGIWEPWITMAIARHVKPGMRCLDVGACYGYYAVLLADIVGDKGRVDAWEPYWEHILLLNANMNEGRMHVYGAAMGTETGRYIRRGDLPGKMFNAGNMPMEPAVPGDDPGRTTTVGEPDSSASYDFVKIDVEGSEMDVWEALAGVRELSPHLTVCMEFTPRQHKDPRSALESIVADGFTMGSVGHDGVPRPCSIDEALVPDTGDFRMLWLTRQP